MNRSWIPSPSLPWFELARLRRHRLTRVAVVAVLAVPLLYGALYVWANIDPTGRLDRVPAAVVNHDEIIEITNADGSTQPIAVGRLLAADLVRDDSRSNYDWVLTDAEDAEDGLADGSYQAVLTIPENLSAAATSTAGDPADAVQGRLDLRTNDAVNYLNGTIARTIVAAARDAVNAQVTETYLDTIYLSFADLRIGLDDAAGGAAELADGAGQLADGAGQLTDGAGQLADGTGELAIGGRALAGGAETLASGLGTLRDATASLPADSARLADGARQVADGTSQLNALVQQVTGGILVITSSADAEIDRLTAALAQLAAQCREVPAPGVDCSVLDAAAGSADQLKALAGQVDAEARRIGSDSQRLTDGAALVAAGNAELAARVPELVGAISQAADGSAQVASGSARLADGAAQASAGAAALADGAGQLQDGAGRLTDGALQLQDGLVSGRDGVPDYDEDDRERLATTAATPLTADAQREHAVANNGEALAPSFMSLALWVGAMAIYVLLRPLSNRAIAANAGSVRATGAGFLPGLALSLGQAVLLVLTIELVVGVDPANRPLLWGVAALTGAVFTAVNQACVAWFGGAGRLLALALVCVQLAAAGGTYPIETAPSLFGVLHDLLPMSYAVHAFRAATAGGSSGVLGDVVALGIFGLLALSATVVAAKRRERVTAARLHPVLVV